MTVEEDSENRKKQECGERALHVNQEIQGLTTRSLHRDGFQCVDHSPCRPPLWIQTSRDHRHEIDGMKCKTLLIFILK